jgi:hypothetical protein
MCSCMVAPQQALSKRIGGALCPHSSELRAGEGHTVFSGPLLAPELHTQCARRRKPVQVIALLLQIHTPAIQVPSPERFRAMLLC